MTPLIRRVCLRHYRSIGACDVPLGPLTFLVGPNGSGKSNFLDALRLVADALRSSLDHALRERGGIQEVRRRSSGHPTHVGVRVDLALDGKHGHFAFELGALDGGGFVIKREQCKFGSAAYRVEGGTLKQAPADVAPPAFADRLYLVNAAGLSAFRPVFDALSMMGFYNLNPDAMRALQPPDAGLVLRRDGANIASVYEQLDEAAHERIRAYLERVVPGIEDVVAMRVGHMETLEFRQRVAGAKAPWRFPAINMSDGTLRTLGILVAAFQARPEAKIRVVGIEEPEAALHPAAAGVLRDCLREASGSRQVIVTSHSPELLDDERIEEKEILAVSADQGTTRIGHIDAASRSALEERLYTPGELLRLNQLAPEREPTIVPPLKLKKQIDLFEDDE